MKTLQKVILPFFLALIFIVATACSGQSSDQSASSKQSDKPAPARTQTDKLIIGLDSDPPQMDPQLSTAAVDRQVFQSVYNTLVDVDQNLKFVPELATSWNISDDGKTYTFKLRQGVLFQDGTPFNAEAVKFNFERMLDPKFGSPRLSEINLVDNVKVVDDYTVEVHLKEPYSPFLSVVSDRAGMMVSPTAVKKEGKDFSNHPVGTGPYKFVSHVKQGDLVVERFDKYWGDKPKIKTIVYKPFTDGNTRMTNLISGDVDIVNQFDYKDIDRAKKASNLKVQSVESLGFQGLQLNTTVAPFDNKKVRQALNLAIDRQAIAKVVFYNGVTPANSPFPGSSWAHSDDFKVPKANVEKAKELLKESGVSSPSFTLKIASSPQTQQLAQMLQSMLQQVGFKVKIEMVEFGTLLEQTDNGDYEAAQIGWSGRVDPDGNAFAWFSTGGTLNYMKYSNPKVDQLLTQARTVSDQAQRKQLYDQVTKIIWDDAPYIFLYYPKDYKAMKSDLNGFVQVPDMMIRTEGLSFK
ncbi:MAG: ABC transporter substrate-binding protein [Tuberibacillus sp.]